MSIKEILNSEIRSEDNIYNIYFHLEGMFWRAYEWSAYLSRFFPSDLNDKERLKVIKKKSKEGDKLLCNIYSLNNNGNNNQ